jgi:glycosyltransferase involved in cell wall biosynthesis
VTLVSRVKEAVKYDCNQYKQPLVFIISMVVSFLKLIGKHQLAFNITASIFRLGWKGSDKLASNQVLYYFKDNPDLGLRIAKDEIYQIEPQSNTARLFEKPDQMIGKIVTVICNPSETSKGVLIVKYSVYFGLFARFFDIEEISNRYFIVLEPSWAGLCELPIFNYTSLKAPVFVQTYEERDYQLIKYADTNLVPIRIGPSWFINHNVFVPQKLDKIYDVIMVAAWAKFKRHDEFFKAIKPCIMKNKNFKIVLVGYPVDMTQTDIKRLIKKHDIEDNVVIFEKVSRDKVSEILSKSKVNVLWSKFEGNNRAIIEGMFCDIPVVLREGHNYGEHYDFINEKTGDFANEETLPFTLEKLIKNLNSLSPREYVLNQRNAIQATRIIEESIAEIEGASNGEWHNRLAVKTNDLVGMSYLDEEPQKFAEASDTIKALQKEIIKPS